MLPHCSYTSYAPCAFCFYHITEAGRIMNSSIRGVVNDISVTTSTPLLVDIIQVAHKVIELIALQRYKLTINNTTKYTPRSQPDKPGKGP